MKTLLFVFFSLICLNVFSLEVEWYYSINGITNGQYIKIPSNNNIQIGNGWCTALKEEVGRDLNTRILVCYADRGKQITFSVMTTCSSVVTSNYGVAGVQFRDNSQTIIGLRCKVAKKRNRYPSKFKRDI